MNKTLIDLTINKEDNYIILDSDNNTLGSIYINPNDYNMDTHTFNEPSLSEINKLREHCNLKLEG